MPELYAFDKHDSIADKLPPGQQDIARVSYELIWDDEMRDDEGVKLCHGLLRSEQRTFDPNPRFVIKNDAQQTDQAPQQDVLRVQRVTRAPTLPL